MSELLGYLYHKTFKSRRTFTFQGKVYKYLCHRYNTTWKNERAVEVPIIWDIVQAAGRVRILEVGNVLSHYYPVTHTILDKYEGGEAIINEDVVDFHPSPQTAAWFNGYDLIVSISTLEHVGWEEVPFDPPKILRAFDNLRGLLAPGGRLVVTLPLAYNPVVDQMLRADNFNFDEEFHFVKVSRDNRWVQSRRIIGLITRYGYPFKKVNGIVIGIIEGGGKT